MRNSISDPLKPRVEVERIETLLESTIANVTTEVCDIANVTTEVNPSLLLIALFIYFFFKKMKNNYRKRKISYDSTKLESQKTEEENRI